MSEELEFVAGDCQQGTCPTIYRTPRETYGFQGPAMTDHGLARDLD